MSDNKRLTASIPDALGGARVDQALAALFPQYSRSRIQQWIRSGHALVDGSRRRQKDLVDGGERVEIQVHADPDERWEPQAIALSITHEDDELLVIDKPAGLVVHPGAGNADGTLVNALLHYCPALSRVPRAGIVHRLDKDTSGLMLVAKTLACHKRLVTLLAERAVRRDYQALVLGRLVSGGRFDEPIGRHPQKRTRMAVTAGGRDAVTHVRVIRKYPGFTHVAARLESGRTHQIRVHLAHAGHPLIGDRTYGGFGKAPAGAESGLKEAVRRFPRQALHAAQLTLPASGGAKPRVWRSSLPADMANLLALAEERA